MTDLIWAVRGLLAADLSLLAIGSSMSDKEFLLGHSNKIKGLHGPDEVCQMAWPALRRPMSTKLN